MASFGHVEECECENGDFHASCEQMGQYFVVNDNAAEAAPKHVAIFITFMGPKTYWYSLLKDLITPQKPLEMSYDNLVGALKTHLSVKALVTCEWFRFQKRLQEDGESAAEYLASLKRLAFTCDLNDRLRDASM